MERRRPSQTIPPPSKAGGAATRCNDSSQQGTPAAISPVNDADAHAELARDGALVEIPASPAKPKDDVRRNVVPPLSPLPQARAAPAAKPREAVQLPSLVPGNAVATSKKTTILSSLPQLKSESQQHIPDLNKAKPDVRRTSACLGRAARVTWRRCGFVRVDGRQTGIQRFCVLETARFCRRCCISWREYGGRRVAACLRSRRGHRSV